MTQHFISGENKQNTFFCQEWLIATLYLRAMWVFQVSFATGT